MIADLHLHTLYSDGLYPPEELLGLLSKREVSIAAFTDHNAFSGDQNFSAEPTEIKKAITCIPNSLELSCEWNNAEIHLLGYNLKRTNTFLTTYLEYYTQAKTEQTRKRCERSLEFPLVLKEKGETIYVSFSDLESLLIRKRAFYWTDIAFIFTQKINALLGSEIMSRRDSISLLTGNEETFHRFEKLFQNLSYFGSLWSTPFKVRHLNTVDALAAIKECGGTSSLAHPNEQNLTLDQILEIKKLGLDCLEVYTPKNTDKQIDQYLDFCKQHDLLISGGTDFHFGQAQDLAEVRGRDIQAKDLTLLTRIF